MSNPAHCRYRDQPPGQRPTPIFKNRHLSHCTSTPVNQNPQTRIAGTKKAATSTVRLFLEIPNAKKPELVRLLRSYATSPTPNISAIFRAMSSGMLCGIPYYRANTEFRSIPLDMAREIALMFGVGEVA